MSIEGSEEINRNDLNGKFRLRMETDGDVWANRGLSIRGRGLSFLTGQMNVVGLFAGIYGIEPGLHGAGQSSSLLWETESAAQAVLGHCFEGVQLVSQRL